MSHEVNDMMADTIRDGVADIWMLPNRPDLEDDCVEYIYNYYIDSEQGVSSGDIPTMVIEFLSKLCSDAISSQDIEYMEKK